MGVYASPKLAEQHQDLPMGQKDTDAKSISTQARDQAPSPQPPTLAKASPLTHSTSDVSRPSLQASVTTHRIHSIKVQGLNHIHSQVITDKFPKNPQGTYTEQELDAFLKTLFATGLFQDVRLDVQGHTLVVLVQENHILSQVRYVGNKEISHEDLDKVVQLKSRQTVSPDMLQAARQALLEAYRARGLCNAHITVVMVPRAYGRVDVEFAIKEGHKAYIQHVTFQSAQGKLSFSERHLRQVVSSKPVGFLNRLLKATEARYSPERLEYDKELLREFYEGQGFIDAKVVSARSYLLPNGQDFALAFVIDEGPRVTFGTTTITSKIPKIDTAWLRKHISYKPGEWFDAKLLRNIGEHMTFDLGKQGLMAVEVEPELKRKDKVVDVVMVIRPITVRRVKNIVIKGNISTNDAVIRRALAVKVGDTLNHARLTASENALERLGYFESVSISESADEDDSTRVVVVEVKEKSTSHVVGRIGFETGTGMRGEVGYSEENFLGRGYGAHANIGLSGRMFEGEVGVSIPYFLQRHVTFSSTAFLNSQHERTRSDSQDHTGYNVFTIGGQLGIDYRLRRHWYQGWSYRLAYENVNLRNNKKEAKKFDDISHYLQDALGKGRKDTMSTVGHTLRYDRVRYAAGDAIGGWKISLSTSLTGLGGSVFNLKNILYAGKFFSLDRDNEWLLRLEARYGVIGGSSKIRFVDQFNLGGLEFPGFDMTGIGPRDKKTKDILGGKQLYTASAKLYFPLGLPKDIPLQGVAYVQAGSLWNSIFKGDDIDSATLKHRITAGIGFVVDVPMLQKIGIIFTTPLVKQKCDIPRALYFVLGFAF